MFAYTQMGTIVNLDRFDGVISSEMKCGKACVYAVRGTGKDQVRMPIALFDSLADADDSIYHMANAMNGIDTEGEDGWHV
ncbi:hypothetical protein ACTNE3_07740 [Bacillota bacterium HCP3S3_F1_1]|jgi:hypothetical protein|nr:hypothetical protein [Eubacterium sp.]MCH3999963.1 hypothetical protein [Lachnospiraceae bacterium]MCH4027322.1 hypothetical protein [Lachnospiraceae bacterium]MCH4065162.1 hypothetical protein [Lachnospiraceae bacterium]MCH4113962.1 hypothetical protein [Lachnospiraceae bacterium]